MTYRSLGFGPGGPDYSEPDDTSPPTVEGDVEIPQSPAPIPDYNPALGSGNSVVRMRQMTGTTADWASCDIVLGLGEVAFERNSAGKVYMKIGNGVSTFSNLPYYSAHTGGGGTGTSPDDIIIYWKDDGKKGIFYNPPYGSGVTVGQKITRFGNAMFNVNGSTRLIGELYCHSKLTVLGNASVKDFKAANGDFTDNITALNATFAGVAIATELTATNQGDPINKTQVPALLDENGRIIRGPQVVFGMTHTLPGGDVVIRFTASDGLVHPIDMVGQNIVNLPDASLSPTNYALTNHGGNIAASVKWVENKFGSIAGANFTGTLDLRDGGDAPPASPQTGDWVVVQEDTYDRDGLDTGMMSDAWWKSLAPVSQQARMIEDGTFDKTVYAGDDLFYDGTKWHYVSASQHHNKFVSRYGDTIAGELKFLKRMSAPGSRPITYAGHGFDIGCAGGTFVSDSIVYEGGDFFKVTTNGGAGASMIGFETNEGSGTKYHTTMFGGNGSLRLAVSGSAYMPPGSAYQQALQGHIGCYTAGNGNPVMRFSFKHDTENKEKFGAYEFNSLVIVNGVVRCKNAVQGDEALPKGQAQGMFLSVFGGSIKGFIDMKSNRINNVAGMSMLGDITMSGYKITGLGAPVNNQDAATVAYVKTNALVRAGGSSDYTAGNNKILNVATPIHGDHAANKAYVDNKVSSVSDERAKENIADYTGGLAAVEAINVVNFNYSVDAIRDIEGDETFWNEYNVPKETQCGVIAQDLEAIFPQAVATSDLGMKSVDYAKLVPVLLSAIQELSDELKALKKGLE